MNDVGQIVGLTVCGLAVLSVIGGVIAGLRMERGVHRTVEPIAPGVAAELDQAPDWWDRHYRALGRKQIPRDVASHEGHRIEEIRTYVSTTTRRVCTDCQVELDPYQGGSHA